jgi:hypothetical protein
VCARCGKEPRGRRGIAGHEQQDSAYAGGPGGGDPGAGDGGKATVITTKRWRSYLGSHRWERIHNAEGGGFYLKCRDCAKFRNVPPTGPM